MALFARFSPFENRSLKKIKTYYFYLFKRIKLKRVSCGTPRRVTRGRVVNYLHKEIYLRGVFTCVTFIVSPVFPGGGT